MAKLNGKQMALAYAGATFCSVTAGAAGGWLARDFGFRIEYDTAIALTWLSITGIPAAAAASNKALRTFGQRPAVSYAASGSAASGGQSYNLVPNGRGGYQIFDFALNLVGHKDPEIRSTKPVLPSTFTVTDLTWSENQDPITITFTEHEVYGFLESVWGRQTSDDALKRRYPFSRNYFTRERKPALDTSEYHGLVSLVGGSGLIVNRTQGKSGKLALRPKLAMNQIKWSFGLASELP